MVAILIGVRWYLIVVLTYIFLIISDAENTYRWFASLHSRKEYNIVNQLYPDL